MVKAINLSLNAIEVKIGPYVGGFVDMIFGLK